MRTILFYLFVGVLFIGCKTEVDNSVQEAFENNSKTALANLEGFESENVDYSMYAKDASLRQVVFGAEKDSMSVNEMKQSDKELWDRYDLKILTKPIVLLPGVNPDTRKADGSVRHYTEWEVTLPATDSTEARSGVIQLYESYDFNAEGKITVQQVYGDFTGLMMYLNSSGE
jgi:hypothetical protein